MANTFNNATATSIGVTETTVYESPSGTTAVIHGLFVANTTQDTIHVTIKVQDTKLTNNVEILSGATLVINKPINLKPTESISVASDTAASCDAFISVLEVA